MNSIRALSFVPFLALTACGGGGGSVNSTPVVPSPSPSPANTKLTDLKASQSFTNDARNSSMSFDLTTETGITGENQSGPLTIRYDAGSNSYSVTVGEKQETFSPGDIVSNPQHETRYQKSDGQTNSYLTLVKVPYYGNRPTEYVGMGYMQRNSINAGKQDTEFAAFTYGFETPAASVPRTGTAGFAIDIFGLSSHPGFEPKLFQGPGTFSTDFAAGVYSAQGYVTETGLVSDDGASGGSIEFISAGRLSSSTGQFDGNMAYSGQDGTIGGTLAGRFYGPNSSELGGAFSGQSTDGATVTGAITGWRDAAVELANLTLTNPTTPTLYYPPFALLTTSRASDGSLVNARNYEGVGQFEYLNSDTFSYGPGLSDLPGATFTVSDRESPSNNNFITYRKSVNGQDIFLDVFRSGSANTQLALTYVTLGRWSTISSENAFTEDSKVYFVHGIETPTRLLASRTGTATYAGIVQGGGTNRDSGAQYALDGTSRFNVDFSRQTFSGALAFSGTRTNGNGSIDFGSYDFSGRLASFTADLMRGDISAGQIANRFYGSDASEVGGVFTMVTPEGSPGAGTVVAGATVAKRQ